MSLLIVTAYNMRFGDAFLLTVPDRGDGVEVTRHILIDVGNVIGREGDDAIYRAVANDILRRLDGRPLDLYVMTHEHMDHVRGLPYMAGLGLPISIDYAWLTASAAEDYGTRFPEARTRLELYEAEYRRLQLAAAPPLLSLLEINNRASTAECVRYLRRAARKATSYVYRGFEPVTGQHHPFAEASLDVWGPEEDTTIYYGRFKPLAALAVKAAAVEPPPADPPPGVEAEGFARLVEYLRSGFGDSMLAIDRAANNTSVVLALEWRGWRLLFPGDADLKSWAIMGKQGVLKPVHFLKVGHHLSRNGTPGEELLEAILPAVRSDSRPRSALVSTWPRSSVPPAPPQVYNGVPDETTRDRIAARVDRVYETASVSLGEYVDVAFEG